MSDKPAVGDTVILYGAAQYYRDSASSVTKKELYHPTVIKIIK
jgi:hypothetical protein